MDIVELIQSAKARIASNDPVFNEQVSITVALLRSLGILSHSRTSMNGHVHQAFAGALVAAYRNHIDVEVYSRRQDDLHRRGASTRIIAWLDDCVAKGVLSQSNGLKYAKGALVLSPLLTHYLEYAKVIHHVPIDRVHVKS